MNEDSTENFLLVYLLNSCIGPINNSNSIKIITSRTLKRRQEFLIKLYLNIDISKQSRMKTFISITAIKLING